MFCPKVVINNFTDFELLYDKFAALWYNGRQIQNFETTQRTSFPAQLRADTDGQK